ncbi:hypothetical protein QTN47_21445 [Danxiaibacter flavus]|uniref:Uncharacterized protein n=1 Tax=Danxiaibacter flavus TaxID=3049108 RepID=A0ABV3ZJX3_9BACT|nr:hypothetical protein QNM32_21450 [Chitinophagaceae bacterium DXS]
MTTIVSKRHFYKFYLSLVLGTFFFITIATVLLFTTNKSEKKEQLKAKDKLIPLVSIACYGFAGYSLYRYIKNVPTISLDKDFISFNEKTFSIADIDKLELTGKRPFKYAINFPMEAAMLTFRNGETKYIFDDMYSNSWEIKSFLKQVVVDKNNFCQISSSIIDENSVAADFYETYKGNQFTSLRGILLWGLIGFFIFLLLTNKRSTTVWLTTFLFCLSFFWFFAFSYQMHFFQVSDNYFLIRNHNFFWKKKKAYKISEIKEIVFETQGKMPNCLRIITKDFRNKLYPAGTLSDKTWLALKDKLETYHIKVRNECI